MNKDKTFITSLFSNLNKSKLNFCVLRNYQKLPDSTGGSDLDIFIDKKNQNNFIKILMQTADDFNGKIISLIESDICPRICLLGASNNGWGLMIDLHYDVISYRGHTILSNSFIWSHTFQYNEQIKALSPKADALNGLFKELLNNGKCESKYYNNFKNIALDKEFLTDIFIDIGKPQLADFFLKFIDIDYSHEAIKTINSKLNSEFPKNRFNLFTRFKKSKRLLKQPGFAIALIGTDGSGKSTLINKIIPALSDTFHNSVYYEHMRPNKLPSIARLLGKKEALSGPNTNPHGTSTSSFFGSFARWSYYMLDYTFGFYIKVFPKKAIRSCMWVFDRYYYDYLIDPKRSRINLPGWILKLGQYFISEPDLILCLGTNPETIHKRKPELPLQEVERQVEALKTFCEKHNKAVWIDTGQCIELSTIETLEAIGKKLSKRFENSDLLR